MTRWRRYVANTGVWGGVKLALLLLVLALLMADEVRTGTWVYSLPILVAAVVITYLARHLLVDNVRVVAPVTNALVVIALVAAILLRSSASAYSPWLTVFVVAFVGLYLGASYWLLSDPRITVQR